MISKYYLRRWSSGLADLDTTPYFSGYLFLCYSDTLITVDSVTISCYKDSYASCSFPHTTRLSACLPVEFFPLTYNLKSFKSRVISILNI